MPRGDRVSHQQALDRLQNVIGRLEVPWRPATAVEGFEIVRRRLFEPLAGPEKFKDRDVVARAFYESYRTQQREFPPECRESDYEKRISAAYPIHPEIFDRLYEDWSTLVKFQRTRGVLRLMAAVIHSLWEKGDRNPLILPSNRGLEPRARQARRAAPALQIPRPPGHSGRPPTGRGIDCSITWRLAILRRSARCDSSQVSSHRFLPQVRSPELWKASLS